MCSFLVEDAVENVTKPLLVGNQMTKLLESLGVWRGVEEQFQIALRPVFLNQMKSETLPVTCAVEFGIVFHAELHGASADMFRLHVAVGFGNDASVDAAWWVAGRGTMVFHSLSHRLDFVFVEPSQQPTVARKNLATQQMVRLPWSLQTQVVIGCHSIGHVRVDTRLASQFQRTCYHLCDMVAIVCEIEVVIARNDFLFHESHQRFLWLYGFCLVCHLFSRYLLMQIYKIPRVRRLLCTIFYNFAWKIIITQKLPNMKLVILDGFAANPGDIPSDPLMQLHDADGRLVETVIYDRTSPEDVVPRAQGAEMVMTNKVVISREVMQQLPALRYIGVLATGYNVVDIDEAHRRGIVVTNIPAYSTSSVAQMVFAHLLHITHHVAEHAQAVRDGRWQSAPDFCFWDSPLLELAGLRLCIVGLGNIGQAVARIGQAMGMDVMAWSSKSENQLEVLGIRKAQTLEELFRQADVLSLHCPLTPETHHLICRETLAWMKPTAILINTGRGPLVDDAALAEALNDGRLYAAALDVLTQEPPRQGSPLISARNCFITPHIAWATRQARERLQETAIRNVEAFLHGQELNRV